MDETECNTDWPWLVDRGTVPLFGVAVGRWGDKVVRLTVVSGGSAEIGDDLQLHVDRRRGQAASAS